MGERINREYKDRLFAFIFGREENKKWTLSLYNAMNGTAYTNENDIEITTMSDTVYMGMKNDVSFIVSDCLSLYEQQSTYNPNMPVRQLMYLGRQYDKYIKDTKQNIYGKSLMKLPLPRLVTFYNGAEDIGDGVLRLSDSFPDGTDKNLSDVQVRVRLVNINPDGDDRVLKGCKPLNEYSWFIDSIRKKMQNDCMSIEDAVETSIDDMPEDYLIREFLVGNRAEVTSMCLTEYDEAETMALFKEETRKETRKETLKSSIINVMNNLKLSAEQAMDVLEIPQEERADYLKMLKCSK